MNWSRQIWQWRNSPFNTELVSNWFGPLQAVENMAERVGFEPTLPFRVNTLSKRAPSATRPSLRRHAKCTRRARNDSSSWPAIAIQRPSLSKFENRPLATGDWQLLLALLGLVQLLGQVVLVGHFFDRVELAFQPVDVVFFIEQNLFHQLARTVVAGGYTGLDPVVQAFHGRVFELQIVLQLLL